MAGCGVMENSGVLGWGGCGGLRVRSYVVYFFHG